MTRGAGRYLDGDHGATLAGCPRFLISVTKAEALSSQGSFEDCVSQWVRVLGSAPGMPAHSESSFIVSLHDDSVDGQKARRGKSASLIPTHLGKAPLNGSQPRQLSESTGTPVKTLVSRLLSRLIMSESLGVGPGESTFLTKLHRQAQS